MSRIVIPFRLIMLIPVLLAMLALPVHADEALPFYDHQINYDHHGLVTGVNLHFAREQNDVPLQQTFTQKQLPGVQLEPAMPFNGQWLNTTTFALRWPAGKEKVQLTLHSLPAANHTPLVLHEGKTSPLVLLATPVPEIKINSLTAMEGNHFFSIAVNYRISGEGVNYRTRSASRIDTDTAASFIRVSPHVDVQVFPGNESITLVGAFAPATRYRIDFRAGLEDNNHAWLRKAQSLTITTPSFEGSMKFLNKARYLPRLNGAELAFEYRNVDQAQIKVSRVPPQNLIFWMTQNGGSYTSNDVAETVLETNLQLPMKKDQLQRSAVDLTPLNQAGKGVYEVELIRKKGDVVDDTAMDSSIVVMTDLAAIAKQSGQDLHVWTRSASDFSQKSGVHVRVMSYNNFELAACTTDEAGACVLGGVMKQKKKPYALILSTADDLSYLRFSDVALNNGESQKQLRAYDTGDTALEAYVYSSRGVYRPGETVDLAAIAWTGDHKAAQRVPLQWKVLSPRQQVLREVSMPSSEFGMSTLQLKLNDYAATGKYQVIVSSGKKQLGTLGFFVEEFMPERIALKISTPKPWVTSDQAARFVLDARYLFGPAVSKGQYQARFSLQPAWFSIPDHPDFATGEYQIISKAPVMLQPDNGVLDAAGRATLSVATGQMRASFPTVMKLTAQVDVNEAGSGRMTHREQSMLIANSPQVLGLHRISSDNGTVHLEGRTFTPDGSPVDYDGAVKLSVFHIYYNWSYSYNPASGYDEWHSDRLLMPMTGEKQEKLKNGRFKTSISLGSDWGEYIVRATMADGQVADLPVSVGYSWFWDEAQSQAEQPVAPDQLQLKPSQSEAKAGDAVAFSFESPFNGQLLFTLESDRVLESRWIRVKKGPNTIKAVTPDVLPNVYATVLLIKDPREGDMYVPARAWGTVSLRVTPQAYTAGLTMQAPQQMRPDRELLVHLQTNDHQQAEFSLAVVDEGILQLTRFATPDPIDYFFAPRRSGVNTYETVGWTFTRSIKQHYKRVGGGMPLKNLGGRVIPTRLVSYWSGVVASDAKGAADIRVPIPPFQGKVRLMAVAAQQGKVGHAEQFTTVSDPLVLQPTLPRFMQQGDRFEIPVFVVNTTEKALDARITVKAGEGVMLEETAKTTPLAAHGSATVYFPARVKAISGAVDFSFTAQSGELSSRDHARIPVLPASSEQTVNFTPPADKVWTLASYLPPHLLAEGMKLSLTASSLPYMGELKQLRSLLRYPYGCLEQTSSGIMPLLYVEPLLDDVLAAEDRQGSVSDKVTAGINRLLTMQTSNGGFAYWSGGDTPVLWGSAYATHVLLAAKNKGYGVPESALEDALNFLQESITSRREDWIKGRNHYYDAEAYIVYVLGLAGHHQKQRIRTLAEQEVAASGHTLEDYFLIMLAAHMAGDKTIADQLMKKYPLFSLASGGEHSSEGSYWSPLRSDALRLSLAEDVWPDDARLEPLRRQVAQQMMQKPYLNTQEAAWSVSALGKIVSRHPKASTKGVQLLINGQPLAPDHRGQGVSWLLSGSALQSDAKIELRYEGKHPPFLTASITAYRKQAEAADRSNSVVQIEREYFDTDNNPIDLKHVHHGQLVQVLLSLHNQSARKLYNVAVVDRLPAGFELENVYPDKQQEQQDEQSAPQDDTIFTPDHVERRDDRIQIFGALLPKRQVSTSYYVYTVRAVSKGDFTAPPASVEMMYEPQIRASSSSTGVHIEP